jgi:hypothetical protein
MFRRVTTVACALLMLLGVARIGESLDPKWGEWLFYGFFFTLFLLQICGIILTVRGYFGPARHPINRAFVGLSWMGTIGALVLLLEMVISQGNVLWLNVAASALMFTGILGSAVVALSASPWRDLFYSRRSDPVLGGDDATHGVPGQQSGSGERHR